MTEKSDKPAEPQTPPEADPPQQEQPRPAEAFKQGIGLLWKAAQSAADEIKREVDKGGVSDALHQAGRDLEVAANQATKALEEFIQRVSPGDPQTSPWPAAEEAEKAKAKQADADVPEDGGVDEETGERRDVRIQLDDD
jgi:hypothetical protein